jgi:hypothetical protein
MSNDNFLCSQPKLVLTATLGLERADQVTHQIEETKR